MDVRDEAAATSSRATSRARVRLVDGDELAGDQLDSMSRLFDEVWGRDRAAGGSIITREVLWVIAHTGGQVTAAFSDDRMVGATAAFVGRDDDGVHLHSHLTAVHQDVAGQGIGLALKLHQRAWALQHGIGHVVWTYDPLVRRNAVLNLLALGARPIQFIEDLYGAMPDARNAGLPTDRFLVRWDLTDPRVVNALTGRRAEPDLAAIARTGGLQVLEVGEDDEPIVTDSDAPRVFAQVPENIEALRQRSPELGQAWSRAVRETIGRRVQAGARVTGITRSGVYVLAEPRGVEELR